MKKDFILKANKINEEDIKNIVDIILRNIDIPSESKEISSELAIFFLIRQLLTDCPYLIRFVSSAIYDSSTSIANYLVKHSDCFDNEMPTTNTDAVSLYLVGTGISYEDMVKSRPSKCVH